MDYDPQTPVERVVSRNRRLRWLLVLLIILIALYYLIFVNQYVVAYRDDIEHFKYGSIGSETANGLPILVFKALPVLYEKQLGSGGYRHFGLLYESPDADLPIGMSRRVVSGVERVWLNCAVCHVGTYRLSASDTRQYIYGAPANNLRLYKLIGFFLAVGTDPGFNADRLITAIDSRQVGGNLNIIEQLLYRWVIFPRVKHALLQLASQLDFIHRQHDWGPGRVDTFNPYKAIQFNFPMDAAHVADTALNGSADFPAIWRQRPREGMHLHWDGNNTSVDERNLSAALGAGVTPVTVDRAAIARVRAWIWDLPSPPFPAQAAIDHAKSDRGRDLFSEYCADCHGMRLAGHAYSYDTRRYRLLGEVEPLHHIGTDPGRWASYTDGFAGSQNLLFAGYPWRFRHFRKTGGYASQPLDGIWARSPYLHNGSVPTLRDLLEPAAKRPTRFLRGSDILDTVRVGYRADGLGAAKDRLFLYDTTLAGNHNTGHEGHAYGTDLSASDKDAIVEYMKTL